MIAAAILSTALAAGIGGLILDDDPLLIAAGCLASCALGLGIGAWIG